MSHTWWTNIWHSLRASLLLWMRTLPLTLFLAIVMLVYARVYRARILEELPQDYIPNRSDDYAYWQERQFGLFDCFTKPDQCMWATLCTPVVAAKNYQVGSVMGYWASCACIFVGLFTFFWPFYCIMACVRTSFSQQLSRNLRLKHNFCKDFFVTLFCFPCDVGRESMEVDEAIGVDLKCCFQVHRQSMTAKLDGFEERNGSRSPRSPRRY